MTVMDWTLTLNELIKASVEITGQIALGEDPTAEQYVIARRELNSIIKYLQAHNWFLWNYQEFAVSTVDGTASYAVTNDDAIGIDEAWIMDGNNRINLEVIDRSAYAQITDKTTEAQPTQVFFDLASDLNAPTLYFYPTPDAVYSVKVRLAKRLRDWDSATDNQSTALIVPQWWLEPLKWKLAANLAHIFQINPNRIAVLEAKAQDLINSVKIDNWTQHDRAEIKFESY